MYADQENITSNNDEEFKLNNKTIKLIDNQINKHFNDIVNQLNKNFD